MSEPPAGTPPAASSEAIEPSSASPAPAERSDSRGDTSRPPPSPPIKPPEAPPVSLTDVKSFVPPEAPAVKSLSKLGVGTELAKWVLVIAGASIVLLLGYLLRMDEREAGSVDTVVNQAMDAATSANNSPAAQSANTLWQIFVSAVPTVPFTKNQIQAAKIALGTLTRFGTIEIAQSDAVNACLSELGAQSPHPDPNRLANCNAIAASAVAKTNIEELDRLRLLRDFAKDAQEHHQALRSFWLQAAQLILLNLLLPVLTALLGYMFGTHEAAKQP